MFYHEPDLKRKIFLWITTIINSNNSTPPTNLQNKSKMYDISINNLTNNSELVILDSNKSITNQQQNFRQTDFSGYNLTIDHIDDFLHKLLHFGTPNNINGSQTYRHEESDCCQGDVRDFLMEYKHEYHGYISLLICIFGTIANILNIIVLTRKDMSKTPINKILKWLSVADMFVMIEYIPFTTNMYIVSPVKNGRYSWAFYLLFHMHFSQILHTISISLTVTLAVWRYVAIKHPHGKFSTFLLSHCSAAILYSFIISPILWLPTFFVFNIKEEKPETYRVDLQENTSLYRFNFWVHSILIKLLPCCILTVISLILVRVLCDASKRRLNLKAYSQTPANLNGNHRSTKHDRRPDRTTMLLVAVLFLFLITEFPQGILGLLSGILGRSFLIGCYLPFGEVMDLLALFNAAVGFVLYGLMSKQFRTSFKSLFFETRLSRLEMTRVTGVTTTCV